jgi:putative DNA methylase
MPLVRSFELSTKQGKKAWVEPIIENGDGVKIRFEVKTGKGEVPESPKTGRGATFNCLVCGEPAGDKNIKAEGINGRMDAQLMAIVAEGKNGRIYLSPTFEQEEIAKSAKPTWYPDGQISDDRRSMFTPLYGLTHFHHLFTNRQLVALTTFSDLVTEAKEKAIQDAINTGLPDDDQPLAKAGKGARAYGEAIAIYLALAVDRLADRNSSLCSWDISRDSTRNTFGRQAIPMVWDFCEANPLSDSTGNFNGAIDWILKVVENSSPNNQGKVIQHDAIAQYQDDSTRKIISSDPPYYDNIGYADLSDFFYVWLRRSIGTIFPNICSTLLVPKSQELVAVPYRFGGDKKKAKEFFEEGLGKAFERMNKIVHKDYPLTVYYAFKQEETEEKGKTNEVISSTGWETMLDGLIKANFSIDGTWPMRSELSNRMVASGTNALASSIVLVCRPRPETAPKTTRRQFLNELKRDLPQALKLLQQGNIAPVDLAQASIGPGMAVFSKYAAVLESDGSPMRVRTALQLINQLLDEFLTEQEGEFDSDTRWALTWFEQHQFNEGLYGDAETLSKAKNTSVQGMVEAGILEAKSGKVRLLQRDELQGDWKPEKDNRIPVWEITQYLIHTLDKQGEFGTAELLIKIGDQGELARDLAYRLYSLCDRKGWTQEAIAYNSLVISWPEITRLARGWCSESVETSLNETPKFKAIDK